MTKWYKLTFLVMSMSRSLSDISLWDVIYARYVRHHVIYHIHHLIYDVISDLYHLISDLYFTILCGVLDYLVYTLLYTCVYIITVVGTCAKQVNDCLAFDDLCPSRTQHACTTNSKRPCSARVYCMHMYVRCGVIFTQIAVLLQLRGTI